MSATRHDGRKANQLRQSHTKAGNRTARYWLHALQLRQYTGDLRSHSRKTRSTLDESTRSRRRMDHSRVLDAPYSTLDRKRRDVSKGKQDGRTVEIQRLIGRSMRAIIDLKKLLASLSGLIATLLACRWWYAHRFHYRCIRSYQTCHQKTPPREGN